MPTRSVPHYSVELENSLASSTEVLEQLIERENNNTLTHLLDTVESVGFIQVKMIDNMKCETNVEINNITVNALIDSGATFNYMSVQLYRKLNNPDYNEPMSKHVGSVIVGNQQSIPFCGSVEMVVNIDANDYKIRFSVLDGPLSSDLILGWKGFMIPNGIRVNGANECIELPIQKRKNGALYTDQPYYLEPLTESLLTVQIRCQSIEAEEEIFIEKFTELFDRTGVVVSPGIQVAPKDIKNRTLSIVLTNMTHKTVCLPANTVVATVQPHDQRDEISKLDHQAVGLSQSYARKLKKQNEQRLKEARIKRFDSQLLVIRSQPALNLINHVPSTPESNTVINREGKLVATIPEKGNSTEPGIETSKPLGIENDKLTAEQVKQFEKFLLEEDDIFTNGTRPSQAVGVTHSIELDSKYSKPVHSSPGRPSQEERNTISKQIAEMLGNGVIKESRSPWSSRIVLIRKKDGKLRFCIDYRRLNSLTKSDVYPLPRIDDSLAALQKGQFFTTLDMFAGNWQIPMEECSKEKTAFISESGLYQFEVERHRDLFKYF